MNTKDKDLEKYTNNMKRASKMFKKLRRSISNMGKIGFHIIRFIIPFVLSPFAIVTFLIIIIFGGIYMMATDEGGTMNINKVKSIVLSKEKIEALGIEIYSKGDNKGKIKGCENLNIPNNIYSSFVEGYSEEVFKTDSRVYDNLCLYHILYVKQIEGSYEFKEEKEIIGKINDRLSNSNDLELNEKSILRKEKRNLQNKIDLTNEALKLIGLKSVGQDLFIDYENDRYGFHYHIDYPISYFKNKQSKFLDMLYYDHIGSTYGEEYPEGISLGGGLFGFGDSTLHYNMLKELGTKYNKDNIVKEFLNGNHGLPDFIEDINSKGDYYNFNCKPCESEDGCSCTGSPEEDYGKDFEEDNLGEKHFDKYIEFIKDLKDKKVIYVSENVKSPFRDYIQMGKSCSVDINLTQRDGPSNLSFGFFKGYPKVDGVKTHAGLDIATYDNCNGDEVPVYSVTEGIVVFKSYSSSAWGNSIIIRTKLADKDYYVRYSHLRDLPKLAVGEYLTTDTMIGVQGDTGPGTGEHLDITIYDGSLEYKDYMRDTLNWGGIFNFTFTDMMQNGFGDYTIGSFNGNSCYNCN